MTIVSLVDLRSSFKSVKIVLVCPLFLVRQYGEMIVQFLVKSTKFGTVIVFGELINFRYRPIRNSFKGGTTFDPREMGWVSF